MTIAVDMGRKATKTNKQTKSLEPSFEPKLFHFHWDIFYYFRKMRPSFKKMFAVT